MGNGSNLTGRREYRITTLGVRGKSVSKLRTMPNFDLLPSSSSLDLTLSVAPGEDSMVIVLAVILVLRVRVRGPQDCSWRDIDMGTTSETDRKGITWDIEICLHRKCLNQENDIFGTEFKFLFLQE